MEIAGITSINRYCCLEEVHVAVAPGRAAATGGAAATAAAPRLAMRAPGRAAAVPAAATTSLDRAVTPGRATTPGGAAATTAACLNRCASSVQLHTSI